MPSLKITPVPFRSSNLAIPTSPFSPRSPLSPLFVPKKQRYNTRQNCLPSQSSKVASPLRWMWQCHQCRQTYPLGATRRCLEDGHEFCAGTSIVKSRKLNGKKIVCKHRACASEFDYAAWKSIGDWRRECMTASTPRCKHMKNCWRNCDYPSECIWGAKTQSRSNPSSPTIPVSPEKSVQEETQPEAKFQQQSPPTTFDALLAAINHPSLTFQSLLSSPTRKTAKEKSPLPTLQTGIKENKDGDHVMTDISSQLQAAIKFDFGLQERDISLTDKA